MASVIVPPPVNAPSAGTSLNQSLWWSAGLIWVAVALVVLFTYPGSDTFERHSLVALSAASKDRPVDIEAHLGQNFFANDGPSAVMSVSVLNRGTAAVGSVRICAEAPGFDLPTDKSCVVSPVTINSGQRVAQEICLKPLAHSGVSSVTVFVEWVASGSVERASVKLGPIRFTSRFGAQRWNRFGRRVAQIIKDVTLPLILVGIGAWLNQKQADREAARTATERQREIARLAIEEDREETRLKIEKKREEDRQRAEEDREVERRKQEKMLADRQQVRLLLLEKVTELAEAHYLPIVSQTKNILLEASRLQMKEEGSSEEKLFYCVLMLLKLMDNLRTSKGGVFLQHRTPERIVGGAWVIARTAIYGVLGDAEVATALASMDMKLTYAMYFTKQPELETLRAAFKVWLVDGSDAAKRFGTFYAYLGALDVLQAVFLFEGDRPLSEDWYEEKSEIRFKIGDKTELPQGSRLPQSMTDQVKLLKTDLESCYKRMVNLKPIL